MDWRKWVMSYQACVIYEVMVIGILVVCIVVLLKKRKRKKRMQEETIENNKKKRLDDALQNDWGRRQG